MGVWGCCGYKLKSVHNNLLLTLAHNLLYSEPNGAQSACNPFSLLWLLLVVVVRGCQLGRRCFSVAWDTFTYTLLKECGLTDLIPNALFIPLQNPSPSEQHCQRTFSVCCFPQLTPSYLVSEERERVLGQGEKRKRWEVRDNQRKSE